MQSQVQGGALLNASSVLQLTSDLGTSQRRQAVALFLVPSSVLDSI